MKGVNTPGIQFFFRTVLARGLFFLYQLINLSINLMVLNPDIPIIGSNVIENIIFPVNTLITINKKNNIVIKNCALNNHFELSNFDVDI